jgi:rubrerythrin
MKQLLLQKYIETAKAMERKGLLFYRSAYKTVSDDNSKGLLQFLVKEEAEHLAYFTKLGKGILSSPKAMKTPLFNKKAYKKVHSRHSYTATIFNTALEMEETGIRFYSGLVKKTRDRKVKALLVRIVNMEKQHFKLIREHQRAIYDSWYWQAMEMPALNT